MTKYRRGEKTECKTTILNKDGNPQDATTLVLVVYEPDGTANTTKAIGDLTRESEGVYYYIFTIPADAAYGDWSYAFTPSTALAKIEDYKYFTVDDFDSGLYCTTMDVYRKAGIDSTVINEGDVADFIKESDAEIRAMYQKSFGNAQTETEWIDIETLDEDEDIELLLKESDKLELEEDELNDIDKELELDKLKLDELLDEIELLLLEEKDIDIELLLDIELELDNEELELEIEELLDDIEKLLLEDDENELLLNDEDELELKEEELLEDTE